MSLLDAESLEVIDSTFVSVLELQAANTEMPRRKKSFLIIKILVLEIVVSIKVGKETHKQFFVLLREIRKSKKPPQD
jgi:hypothetical protein